VVVSIQDVYKVLLINVQYYFLISVHLSNSITSDNRDPNNALNSDMGVVWGLLCLHPNTIKLRYIMILTFIDIAYS
jgi:hypothetical protein